MPIAFTDRLTTIAATATLVSAGWILFGSIWLGTDLRSLGIPGSASSQSGAWQRDADIGQLTIPVPGIEAGQLADTYADPRADGARLHEAIDIMAPAGTPVVAAAPGTIERLHQSPAGGTTIYLRSPDRETIQYYAHLAGYAPGLAEGQQVRRGQRLGTVGATGNADPGAPHLHFAILRTTPQAEWWEPATALNPYPLLTAE